MLGQGERRTAGGRAADAKAKLTRLYEAIEDGLTDLDDANLKGRIAELRRIRDAARATRDRPRSPPTCCRGSRTRHVVGLRRRTAVFRQHHVQALVQRVEIGTDEIRIKGSRPSSC